LIQLAERVFRQREFTGSLEIEPGLNEQRAAPRDVGEVLSGVFTPSAPLP
jgi:hypothetical protein